MISINHSMVVSSWPCVFPVTFYTGDDGEAQKYTQQAQKAALQMGFVLVSRVLVFYFDLLGGSV
jgi:hypothetical protein